MGREKDLLQLTVDDRFLELRSQQKLQLPGALSDMFSLTTFLTD